MILPSVVYEALPDRQPADGTARLQLIALVADMTPFVNPDLADQRAFAANDAGEIRLRPTLIPQAESQE